MLQRGWLPVITLVLVGCGSGGEVDPASAFAQAWGLYGTFDGADWPVLATTSDGYTETGYCLGLTLGNSEMSQFVYTDSSADGASSEVVAGSELDVAWSLIDAGVEDTSAETAMAEAVDTIHVEIGDVLVLTCAIGPDAPRSIPHLACTEVDTGSPYDFYNNGPTWGCALGQEFTPA